jgi:adenylate kinase family enzyme
MLAYNYRKILILGDAGRGKTTFAEKLSKKISIPHYSTDDFFWKVKFTEPNDKGKSVEEISHIYRQDEWIMEGTTRRLIREGLEKADIIYLLKFGNIFSQYYYLIRRKFKRKHESFGALLGLLKHVTYKKYKKGYGNHTPPLSELIEPYKSKVVGLNSIKEINKCLEVIN